MTLQEFKKLNRKLQLQAICGMGVKLGNKEQEQYSSLLYSIDAFYVEVTFEKPEMRVTYLRPFGATPLLDPYLEQIDISPLLKGI